MHKRIGEWGVVVHGPGRGFPPRGWLLLFTQREQVGEEAVGAGDAGGEFAEED